MRSDMLQQAFAFERAVVTPSTFVTIVLPAFFSYYAMAVLVQLPRTGFYRAALLPIVFWSSCRAGMSLDLSWNYPCYLLLNQGLALSMFIVAMRGIVWALAQQPYYRTPICKADDGATSDRNGYTQRKSDEIPVSSAMWNAWNLISNPRGIGWSRPENIYIPTPYFRVESRPIFALLCFCWLIFLMLVFDIVVAITFWFGPGTILTAEGDSIFDSSLPAPQRYLKSTIITLLTGINVYVLVDSTYHIYAVLFTMLFRQHPLEWPPLLDSPWLSTSLNSLWGKRWHQYLREVFVEVGGRPLERYLGKVGFVIGAFTISGLLHDIGARGMDRGAHLAIAGFFIMQGIGVMMEVGWKEVTGKRVGGFTGWLWVCFWLLLWGNGLVDAWARIGLFEFEFAPEAYRPTKILLNWIS